MELFDRRQLLTIGGAMLLGQRIAEAADEPAPPPAAVLPQNWRRAPSIALWPGDPPGFAGYRAQPVPAGWTAPYRRNVAMPQLQVFRPRRPNGIAVLAMPGGAYWFVSVGNEGADLAPRLTSQGYTVFVLTYRLPGEGWEARADVPLQDAQRAMRLIRARAKEFQLDAAKVAVLGFSAGGHLAATLATQHAEVTYRAVDAVDAQNARPFAAGLIYPVVTMQAAWTHELSRRLLLGELPSAAEVDRRSAELHVRATTPPTFLVHAMDDTAVPVENSVQLMSAMRAAGRPVEAHFLQEGGHAFGIGRPGTPSAQWISLWSAWLERVAQAAK
ncbi:MAG: alpha/beta hydrolase [Steroidobacteraceae bacterium]